MALEVLNGDRTMGKVYVLNLQPQGFADTAAQPKQKPDEETIPKIGGGSFKTLYFTSFQIGFGHFSTPGKSSAVAVLIGFVGGE